MNRICLIIFISLLFTITVKSQTPVTPEVINSAGGSGSAGGGVEIDWSIGETVITTLSNTTGMLTQGFLQPPKFGLSALAYVTPVSCADKTDGIITIRGAISGNTGTSTDSIVYKWAPKSLCASSTCSSVANLAPGTYSVMVFHYNGGVLKDSVVIQNIVVAGSTEPCQITIYNGMTPNGDGVNDYFAIDNIEQFPGNIVSIYNRWGQRLAEIKDYDNKDSAHRWEGTMPPSNNTAPSGTYFYIIDLNNGTKPVKGWLELTHR